MLRTRAGLIVAVVASTVAVAQAPNFSEVHESVPRSADAHPLAAADFDGDGDVDLLRNDGVLFNDGSARFHPAPSGPTTEFRFATLVVVGDFDLDGDLDAVHLDGWNTTPVLALNDGTGTFTGASPLSISSGGTPRETLFADDVNGDGLLDLIGAMNDPSGLGSSVVVWTNLGGATFVESTFQGVSGWTEPIGTGDVDGDARADLLINDHGGTGLISLRMASWSGGSWTLGPVLVGPDFYVTAVVDDWNEDGFADVLAWNAAFASPTSVVQTFFFGGAAGLNSPTTRGVNNVPVNARRFDFDGQSPSEILFETPNGLVITEIPGAAPPSRDGVPILPAESFTSLTADFDGDGDVDVLAMSSSYAPRIAFNAAGAFVSPDGALPATFAAARRAVIPMDFDGDGDGDLVAAGFDQVAVNDGIGAFDVVPMTPPSPAPPSLAGPACVADWNGDGVDDVLMTYGGTTPRIVYGSPSGGAFTTATIATSFVAPRGVVSGDLDGDGDPDVVVVDDPSGITLLVNGGGAWTATVLESARRVRDVALVDLDDDGDLDVVAACRAESTPATTDPTWFYVNQGGGVFVAQAPPFVVEADAVAAGDLDGDGTSDLVLDGVAYLRSGAVYTASGAAAADPGDLLGAAIADLDEDGLAELCSASGWSAGIPGGGFGAFTAWPIPLDYVPWPYGLWAPRVRVTPVDFDGDGDLDFAPLQPAVFTNRLRQLERGSIARPGRLARVEFSGPPSSPLALMLSETRAVPAVDLGSWGFLHADPATSLGVFSGMLDAEGASSATFMIPNVPSLVGYEVWCQTALPSVGKLTNAVHVVILGL
jgi:hypothetical protein